MLTLLKWFFGIFWLGANVFCIIVLDDWSHQWLFYLILLFLLNFVIGVCGGGIYDEDDDSGFVPNDSSTESQAHQQADWYNDEPDAEEELPRLSEDKKVVTPDELARKTKIF